MPTFTAFTPASATLSHRLPLLRYIANDLQLGEFSASFTNTLQHTFGMTVRGVNQRTSTPASTNAAIRSSLPAPAPTAAPTRRRPCSSLHAFGLRLSFLEVFNGDHAAQVEVFIHDQRFQRAFHAYVAELLRVLHLLFTVTRRL